MWAWVSYFNPHRFTWGDTQELQVAYIVAVATIAAWLLSREPKRIPLNAVTVLLLIFAAWTSVTTLFALVPIYANELWKDYMKILLMSFIALPLIRTQGRLNALIWVTVLSIGYYGVKGGIFSLLTGGEFIVMGPPGSAIEANNGLALALIMIFPLLRYLQLEAKPPWLRWGLGGSMLLCGASIAFTYSRGAFVAMTVTLFLLMLKSRRRLMLGFVAVLAIIVGLSLTPEKWFERIASIETYEQDASVQGRFQAWRVAFGLAVDHPLVGGGFNVTNSSEIYGAYVPDATNRAFHSIYFQVLGEHGFIGLTLFLMIGLAALRMGTLTIRQTRNRPDLIWAQNLTAMLQVSLIGYAVGGVFLNKAYFDLYYSLLVFMVVARVLVLQALQEDVPPVQSEPQAHPAKTMAPASPAPRMPPH